MFEQFLNHIRSKSFFDPEERILLAVSGGVDSMVMLRLFEQAGYKIGIAHCNFQLRGEESDADEALVKKICLDYQVPCYTTRFDTNAYASEKRLSIQLAARTLRYNFFQQIAEQHGYTAITTAHHAGDNIETILINLIRGTGLDGLTGIPERNDNIIRPLLPFTRQQILDFAVAERLEWREDASNASDDYQRNVLRNQVIPVFRQLNPAFEETFSDTLERITGSKQLATSTLEKIRASAVSGTSENIVIDAGVVKGYVSPVVALWELIKRYGFNYDQCKNILREHQSGKIFQSDRYQLTVDRNTFLINNSEHSSLADELIGPDQQIYQSEHLTLGFEKIDTHAFRLTNDNLVAYVDMKKINYPLVLRTWKAGDRFQPLGMKTSKKLSDFLIDLKVPVPDKAKVTVLESGGAILWVIGYRISEKFKVDDQTERVLKITAALQSLNRTT